MKLLRLAAATALAAACGSAQSIDDAYIKKALQDWNVPGVSLAVVKDDKIVAAKGYGVRDLKAGGSVDENTMFAIGSTTKAFTSASMAMLVDEGKVKWDDPVTKYLPGFELYDPWVTREFTVRDSMAHRSGLGRRGDLLWYGSGLSRDEILYRIRFLKPSTSFRSAYGYQNIMFLLAGQLVAAASGNTWDGFVKQRIFAPLGMSRSNTSTNDLTGVDNVAQPHEERDGHLTSVPYRNVDNIGPAGSINSCSRDMAEWLRFQLGDGTYNGHKLVSAAALRETRMPQTIIPSGGGPDPHAHFHAYCMGWVAQDYRGKYLVSHNGAIDGMKSMVLLVPEQHLGVVVLANRGGTQLTDALGYWLIDTWMGTPGRDWSAEMLAVSRKAEQAAEDARKKIEQARVPNTHPTLALEKYAGTYADDMYGDQRITVEGGRLVLHGHPVFSGPLEHWHYDTFRTSGQGAFVTFSLDANAEVSAVAIQGLGDFHRKSEANGRAAAATPTRR